MFAYFLKGIISNGMLIVCLWLVLQASYYTDPVRFYSYVHACGIGTRASSLYISWAQQCEKKNQPAQAEHVYQKALENHAEPLEALQEQYRWDFLFTDIEH